MQSPNQMQNYTHQSSPTPEPKYFVRLPPGTIIIREPVVQLQRRQQKAFAGLDMLANLAVPAATATPTTLPPPSSPPQSNPTSERISHNLKDQDVHDDDDIKKMLRVADMVEQYSNTQTIAEQKYRARCLINNSAARITRIIKKIPSHRALPPLQQRMQESLLIYNNIWQQIHSGFLANHHPETGKFPWTNHQFRAFYNYIRSWAVGRNIAPEVRERIETIHGLPEM